MKYNVSSNRSHRRSNVLGMQYFEFAKPNQICLNVITIAQISPKFSPNIALILPKSNHICPILINFTKQKFLLKDAAASFAFPATTLALVIIMNQSLYENWVNFL